MSEPTPYKWENVSVRVDRWKRLQALCEELEPHQHYDGQNECQVCDEPLTGTLIRHLETLAAQRTALLALSERIRREGMQGVANSIEEIVNAVPAR